jgi:spore coat polysaccharide biosynthesis predicted glycosyltransferase SpsG
MSVAWLRCVAGADLGLGHLMRSIALLEAAGERGFEPTVVADVVAGTRAAVHLAVGWLAPGDEGWLDDVRAGDLVVLDGTSGIPGAEAIAPTCAERGARVLLVDEDDRPTPDGVHVRVAPDWTEVPSSLARSGARVLTGPAHALVRREVVARRRPRRGHGSALVVSMGGSDVAGASGAVVRAALAVGWGPIELVLGPAAPDADGVGGLDEVRLHRGPPSVAEVLDGADAVVVSGGNTAWEVCCMGLPAVVVAVAPDQHRAIELLDRDGAAVVVDWQDATQGQAELVHALRGLTDPARRSALAAAARSLVDGEGARRCLDAALGAA